MFWEFTFLEIQRVFSRVYFRKSPILRNWESISHYSQYSNALYDTISEHENIRTYKAYFSCLESLNAQTHIHTQEQIVLQCKTPTFVGITALKLFVIDTSILYEVCIFDVI